MLSPTTISQNINLESSPTANTMSLSTGDISFVNAGTLEIGRNDNSALAR